MTPLKIGACPLREQYVLRKARGSFHEGSPAKREYFRQEETGTRHLFFYS